METGDPEEDKCCGDSEAGGAEEGGECCEDDSELPENQVEEGDACDAAEKCKADSELGLDGLATAGPARINPHSGNLMFSPVLPGGDAFDPRPGFSYNSQSGESGPAGDGWTQRYQQSVQSQPDGSVQVVNASGSVLTYSDRDPVTGVYTPQPAQRTP